MRLGRLSRPGAITYVGGSSVQDFFWRVVAVFPAEVWDDRRFADAVLAAVATDLADRAVALM